MPNCFTLTRKGFTTPATLQVVDAELCQNLDLPYDDKEWTHHWYDYIGLRLALGQSFEAIIDDATLAATEDYVAFKDYYLTARRIAAYLNEHYTPDAWWEPKH